MLPALIDDLPNLTANSSLQGTLLGQDFLLLGLDAESRVVVRQPLRRADEALSQRRADPIPVVHFDNGHPLARPFTPGVVVRNAVLYLLSEGWSATTDDTAQIVEAWTLAGIEGAEPFPLGTLVTVDDEQVAKAAGRMWCCWEVAPVTVYPRQRLPFAPTDPTGAQSRTVLTGLTSVDADPLTYQARAAGPSNGHLLAFDVRALMETLPQDRYLDDLTGLGNAVRGLAGRLLTQRFGEDGGDNPLTTLPVCDEVLFDPEANGDALLARVLEEGEVERSSYVDIATDTIRNPGATARYFHFKDSLTLPSGKGIRVTMRVAANGQGAGIKLCRAEGSYTSNVGLIEVVGDAEAPWARRVSSYTGHAAVGSSIPPDLLLREDTGRELPLLEGQRYEAYIYPDRHAFVFVNGVYIHRLRVNACDWEPGSSVTFRMSAVTGELRVHELRVESFTVPADHSMESPVQPQITMVDWSQATSVDEDNLAVDSTSVGFLLNRYAGQAEFVLTEPSRFRFRAALQQSPTSEPVTVALQCLHGGSYHHTLSTINGLYEFPGTLPAGKYRLSLSNHQYSEVRRVKECNYTGRCDRRYVMGRGWVYQCWNGWNWVDACKYVNRTYYYDTNHDLRVYHWKAVPA